VLEIAVVAVVRTVVAGVGPAKAGPAKAGPAEAGPAKAGPAKAGPAKAGPADVLRQSASGIIVLLVVDVIHGGKSLIFWEWFGDGAVQGVRPSVARVS